jgi:hypothetical protein
LKRLIFWEKEFEFEYSMGVIVPVSTVVGRILRHLEGVLRVLLKEPTLNFSFYLESPDVSFSPSGNR